MNKILQSLKNPVVQQYGLELLFPIIGYLFFGWSFLLIILFYLVDQLGNQVNFFARLKFTERLHLPKKKGLFFFAIAGFTTILLLEFVLIYYLFSNYLYDCQSTFLTQELKAFLVNEFWLFLPLLIAANYFKDKMTFYKTDLPYQESPIKMVVHNLFGLLNSYLLVGLMFLAWWFFKPSSIVLIILIAICKLFHDILILPKIKSKYFKKF